MSVKLGVLGLIVERRGYGYDLVRRFNGRFGETWALNQSTVYASIDALYARGLVTAYDETGAVVKLSKTGPRRSPKVIYEATSKGCEELETWLTAPIGQVEPLRMDLFLKLGLATQEHALALLQVVDAHIDACTNALAERLANYGLDMDAGGVRWQVAATYYISDAGIGRLQADLAWLRRVRAGVEALRVYGYVPLSALASPTGLSPGWR